MKKIVLFFIALAVAISFTACESGNQYLEDYIYCSQVIPPLNDSVSILNSDDIFESIDWRFDEFSMDQISEATDSTRFDIFSLKKDATSGELFGSFNRNLESLCFTQSQIVYFCKYYADLLRGQNCATLFLFKEHGQYWVTAVYRFGSPLDATLARFDDSMPWQAKCGHFIVVPR